MEGDGGVKDWGQGGLTEPLGPPARNAQLILGYTGQENYSEIASGGWVKPGQWRKSSRERI